MVLYNRLKTMFDSIDFTAVHLEGQSKLKFYEAMFWGSNLESDLKFQNSKQEALINQFCNMGPASKLSLGESAIAEFRNALGITYEDEKEMFTKVFVRDYLKNTEERNDLGLKDGYSAGEIFQNFASEKLREDKDFVTTMLKLDGRNLPFMNVEFQNDVEIVEMSIKSDTSNEVDSFTKINSSLKHNPYLAVEFIKKYQYNQSTWRKANKALKYNPSHATEILREYQYKQDLIERTIYDKLFQKDDKGNYPKDIFKNDEQLSWISDSNFVKEILIVMPEFVRHITEGNLHTSNNAFQKKKV